MTTFERNDRAVLPASPVITSRAVAGRDMAVSAPQVITCVDGVTVRIPLNWPARPGASSSCFRADTVLISHAGDHVGDDLRPGRDPAEDHAERLDALVEDLRDGPADPRRHEAEDRVDDAWRRHVLDFFGRGDDRGAREKRCEGDHACDGACVSHGVTSVAAQSVLAEALTLKNAFARLG